jgi:hypothetical protein
MSQLTDKMEALTQEAEIAAQTDDYSLKDEVSLLTRMNRTLLEAHSRAVTLANEYIDAFKAQKEEFQKLADRYRDLQQKDDQTPELFFTGFSLDPAGTLEVLLKSIERTDKIEDQSGEAWKWGYRLTFRHRAKIAIKLLMGTVKV